MGRDTYATVPSPFFPSKSSSEIKSSA